MKEDVALIYLYNHHKIISYLMFGWGQTTNKETMKTHTD